MTLAKEVGGLGFRDLHIFNRAMLSWQCWRILQNPDSLCVIVLKARYFPNSSVLEAKPRSDMSYTWRSILSGLELLKPGVVWRVGDGENIKVLSDPWILRGTTRGPVATQGLSIIS